jgi:hypothetical protein
MAVLCNGQTQVEVLTGYWYAAHVLPVLARHSQPLLTAPGMPKPLGVAKTRALCGLPAHVKMRVSSVQPQALRVMESGDNGGGNCLGTRLSWPLFQAANE